MRLNCTCGKALKVGDDLAGKKVRCPFYRQIIVADNPARITSKQAAPRPLANGKDQRITAKPSPQKKRWIRGKYTTACACVGIVLAASLLLLLILKSKGYLGAEQDRPNDKERPQVRAPILPKQGNDEKVLEANLQQLEKAGRYEDALRVAQAILDQRQKRLGEKH